MFSELSAMPEHQLTVVPAPPARYRAWVLAGLRWDFSDAEVNFAVGMAPILGTPGQVYDRSERWYGVAGRVGNQADLTARKRLLGVLAEGLPQEPSGGA